MLKLVPLILLTLSSLFAEAQTVITGKIKDNRNRPMAGVSIAIKDSYDGATSDSLGNFRFKTTDKGAQILQFTSIGFKLLEIPINLDGTTITQNVVMKEEPNELTAVVISV